MSILVKYRVLSAFVMGNNLLWNSERTGRRRGIRWSIKFPSYFPSLKEFSVTVTHQITTHQLNQNGI